MIKQTHSTLLCDNRAPLIKHITQRTCSTSKSVIEAIKSLIRNDLQVINNRIGETCKSFCYFISCTCISLIETVKNGYNCFIGINPIVTNLTNLLTCQTQFFLENLVDRNVSISELSNFFVSKAPFCQNLTKGKCDTLELLSRGTSSCSCICNNGQNRLRLAHSHTNSLHVF